ncbi:MAG: amidohydrolase [Bacteroidetes bacterium]|nr:amidohydrolase [Bacteroidota bacterium]
MKSLLAVGLSLVIATTLTAQVNPKLQLKLDQHARELEQKTIEWRRYFHQYPELSNQEVKTSAKIAEILRGMGLEVKTGVARTGVVATLNSGKPGRVVALRADMDALPVEERNDLTFASKERIVYNDRETSVMHACGHDSHMAILLAVAEILVRNKADLKGQVKFIFQPAEEGAGTLKGGAAMMVEEGVLENPKVDAIFGLHIQSTVPAGTINYRSGALMAAPDFFTIKVRGKGAHGATPWDGVDPLVVGAQIVMGIQTIISRQLELTKEPAVITIGKFTSGNRENIIPESAEMGGTIRTFDKSMQKMVHEKIRTTAMNIAESAGATAEVIISSGSPVTYNDPSLTASMAASLERAAGKGNALAVSPVTMAEDFSEFQQKIPGLFFFIGGMKPGTDPKKAPIHHTPDFMLDESGFGTGVKALVNLTVDFLYRDTKLDPKK